MRFSLVSVFRGLFILTITLLWTCLGIRRSPSGAFILTMTPVGVILAAIVGFRISGRPLKSIITFAAFGFAWLFVVWYAETLMLACFPPLSVSPGEQVSLDLEIFVWRMLAVILFVPAAYLSWMLYVGWIRSANNEEIVDQGQGRDVEREIWSPSGDQGR